MAKHTPGPASRKLSLFTFTGRPDRSAPYHSIPARYRGLWLDGFQQEAIWHLENDRSVLVTAPTGTGKTLIAEWLIDRSLARSGRVIYTAPLKALVNQKYSDFRRKFGASNVGIMTGDVSERPDAGLVIMTTEIYRNMVRMGGPDTVPGLRGVTWVVFDEFHYLAHPSRGGVWEEAILLTPKSVRLLGLSATVPNADEVGAWIEKATGAPTAVVNHTERAVPLEHLYFNNACEAVPRSHLGRSHAEAALWHSDAYDYKAGTLLDHEMPDLPGKLDYRDDTRHMDLVFYAARRHLFPCIYFVFSRRGCEEKAKQLARRADFLTGREKNTVRVLVAQTLKEAGLSAGSVPGLPEFADLWAKGIGVHHAGLVPIVREIVEKLVERRIIKVVYATETFAVGVNMPARSVCFDSLKKWDGQGFRFLTAQEYFQMAGRAGRRGIDRSGTVISLVDFSTYHKEPIPEWDESRLEPLTSRMTIDYNMVANLTARFSNDDIEKLMGATFANFQSGQGPALLEEFRAKQRVLRSLGYLDEGGDLRLTHAGEVLRRLFVQELLVAGLITRGALGEIPEDELPGLAAALVPGADILAGAVYSPPSWVGTALMIAADVEKAQRDLGNWAVRPAINVAASAPVTAWARGAALTDILREFPISGGDFVALCRQAIDLLRQMADASRGDHGLRERFLRAISLVDRDMVKVRL